MSILNSVSLAEKTLSKNKPLLRLLFICFLSNFLSCVLLEKGLGRRRPCGYGFGSWTGGTRGGGRNPLRRFLPLVPPGLPRVSGGSGGTASTPVPFFSKVRRSGPRQLDFWKANEICS